MRRQNKKQTTCVTSTDQRKYISIAEGDCETRNQNLNRNALYYTSLSMSTMTKSSTKTTLKFQTDNRNTKDRTE